MGGIPILSVRIPLQIVGHSTKYSGVHGVLAVQRMILSDGMHGLSKPFERHLQMRVAIRRRPDRRGEPQDLSNVFRFLLLFLDEKNKREIK